MNIDKSSDVKKMLKFCSPMQQDLSVKKKPYPLRKTQSMVGLWVRKQDIIAFHYHYMVFFQRTDKTTTDNVEHLLVPNGKEYRRVDYDGDFPGSVSDDVHEYVFPRHWKECVKIDCQHTFSVNTQPLIEFLRELGKFWNDRGMKGVHPAQVSYSDAHVEVIAWNKLPPAKGGNTETYPEACKQFETLEGGSDLNGRWTLDTKPLYRFLSLVGKKDDILEVTFNHENPYNSAVKYKLREAGHEMYLMYYR